MAKRRHGPSHNQVNHFDRVKITGGNTPLDSSNTITAALYGSGLQKDQTPTNLSFAWQSRLIAKYKGSIGSDNSATLRQ